MIKIELTEEELQRITLALRVAADVYKQDAKNAAEMGVPRVVEQFQRQAKQATELHAKLEACEEVAP